MSLSPFYPTSSAIAEWREAILDILEYTPNVVVVTESSGMVISPQRQPGELITVGDFRASILRRNIVEITSPRLDGGHHEEPDLTRAREEPVSTDIIGTDGIAVRQVSFEKVDRILRHFPAGFANWYVCQTGDTDTQVHDRSSR
jgi:hypothetical protein